MTESEWLDPSAAARSARAWRLTAEKRLDRIDQLRGQVDDLSVAVAEIVKDLDEANRQREEWRQTYFRELRRRDAPDERMNLLAIALKEIVDMADHYEAMLPADTKGFREFTVREARAALARVSSPDETTDTQL